MYFVCIFYSPTADRYYVGQTENLDRRLEFHNRGGVFSTKPYGPWELKYTASFATRAEAMRREREIKNHQKRSYIESLVASAQQTKSRARD